MKTKRQLEGIIKSNDRIINEARELLERVLSETVMRPNLGHLRGIHDYIETFLKDNE